jgi:ABC-type Mn2+/Zn2+ transport system permease subunit
VLDPFRLEFVQRGALEVLLLSGVAGLLGTWIVLRGLAFLAHAVGTATFPGLVLADGLGFAAGLGALGSALLFALSLGTLGRRAGDSRDGLTALVLVGALSAGVVLASDVFGSGAGVDTLLFGSLLLLDEGDLAVAAGTTAVLALAGLVLDQRWLATGFDAQSARDLGLRSPLPDLVLLALVAVASVAVVAAVGALLATAVLVVPAATTRLVCRRLRPWQVATTLLAAAEGVAGLWLSVQLDVPPGPAVAVLAGAVFALVAVAVSLPAARAAARPDPVGAA